MPDFLLGFVFLCFLICDYTTRHVRCQDTCVYYCKGERNLYKTTATRKNLVTGLNGSEWENGFETEKHYELLRLLNSFAKNHKLAFGSSSANFSHNAVSEILRVSTVSAEVAHSDPLTLFYTFPILHILSFELSLHLSNI